MANAGNWSEVARLLNPRADPMAVDEQGLTAMNHAIYRGNVRVVDVLSSHAPSALLYKMPAQCRGSTCLHQAAALGDSDIIKVLLNAGGGACSSG